MVLTYWYCPIAMVLLALSYWYCFMDYVLSVLLKPRHHVNNGMPSFCSLCMLHLLIIVCHGVSVGCGQVVCYRFFKPTPQRYQMLAWALNPTFPKEKYLGSERAAMCDAVATNEIKRRQQTTETFTAGDSCRAEGGSTLKETRCKLDGCGGLHEGLGRQRDGGRGDP